MIFAHRGLSSQTAPENSLAAFRSAMDAGFGIELDVRLSKDRVPVVFHDRTLKRMCSVPKKVSELTIAELKKLRLKDTDEQIPTLAETLEFVGGRVPLLIETKLPKRHLWFHTLERRMIPVLAGYNGEFLLQSFNRHSMRFLKRKLPDIPCGILSGGLYPEPDGFDFISYKLLGMTPDKAEKLRRRYPMVFGWSLLGLNERTLDEAFGVLGLDAVII